MATPAQVASAVTTWFEREGVRPADGTINRIVGEVMRGERSGDEIQRGIENVGAYLRANPDGGSRDVQHRLVQSRTIGPEPGRGGGEVIRDAPRFGEPDPSPAPSPAPDDNVGDNPPPVEVPTRDWRADAKARWQWLTPGLLSIFAEQWAKTNGNGDTALAYVRQSGEYARVFPGIKRDDGSLRMSENEYFSTKASYTETLQEFGRNPADYQSKYTDLFRNDVSAQEFYRATESAVQRFHEPGAKRDNGLVDKYLQGFFGSGSAEAALESVRNSSEYDKVFEGNRREDGTLRMDEPEYFSYKRGWQRLFLSRGLNPEPFMAKGRMVDAVEGEVSIQELDSRIGAVEQGIMGNRAEVAQFFTQQYGDGAVDFLGSGEGTLQSALAMAIDPEVGKELLSRQITASQIGGEAAVQGFARSVDRAEKLARAGIGQGQARELYGQAASQLSGLDATTRRFNRGGTGIGAFEEAIGLGDADQQLRLTRSLQDERSSFSGRRDTRRSQDGFGLRGLRQR